MSLNYELIPFEKICRTCLSQCNEFRSLFSIDEPAGETLRLSEMLMCCASVQIMLNDGLPSQICMQCVQYINRAYSFRQLCERSENTLRELLGRPIQQTFLELKPLLTTEALIANPLPEIIAESFPTTLPLSETFTITGNINTLSSSTENVNSGREDLITESENITKTKSFDNESQTVINVPKNSNIDIPNPILKVEITSQEELNVHEQNIFNESIQIEDSSAVDIDSDVSQGNTNEQQITKKKLKTRDETEQPVYPCDYCMECFTKQRDLKIAALIRNRLLKEQSENLRSMTLFKICLVLGDLQVQHLPKKSEEVLLTFVGNP